MPEYEDKELTCVDCKQSFIFPVGEQEFFAEKDFPAPKRCPGCREKKRLNKEQGRGPSKGDKAR